MEIENVCVVEFPTKKTRVLYVGKVLAKNHDDETVTIDFCSRSGTCWVKPQNSDISDVETGQINMVLPDPIISGGTARARNALSFGIDLPDSVL